jgi:hypothetical protein
MDSRTHRTRVMHWLALVAILASTLLGAIPSASPVLAAPAPRPAADHTANPTSVTIVGSLQSELGCGGDWDPGCNSTFMDFDAEDDVWQRSFSVPAGDWLYKAALNGSWAENYGVNATPNGDNIPLNLGVARDVKFYYDHKSHWVTDNENSVIATAAGDFQSEVGCTAGPNGGDWEPSCLRSWLQDVDGDGIYTFETAAIPPGNYQAKVALNESWDVSFGQGGGGDNIPFTVGMAGDKVTISFDSATNIPTIKFYFVMADRFANGNTTNDNGGLTGGKLTTGFDPTDKAFYHGGDLAGIIAETRLHQGHGHTAIWLTPSLQEQARSRASPAPNRRRLPRLLDHRLHPDRPAPGHQRRHEGAHRRRPRQGHEGLLRHHHQPHRGRHRLREGAYDYRSKKNYPYKDSAGTAFDDRDYVNKTFPAIDPAVSFPYTPFRRPTPRSRRRRGSMTRQPLPQPRRLAPSPASPRPTATSSGWTTSSPSAPRW